jgi:hypothetical protein
VPSRKQVATLIVDISAPASHSTNCVMEKQHTDCWPFFQQPRTSAVSWREVAHRTVGLDTPAHAILWCNNDRLTVRSTTCHHAHLLTQSASYCPPILLDFGKAAHADSGQSCGERKGRLHAPITMSSRGGTAMASLPTQEYIGKAGAAGPARLVTEPVQTCIRAAAHALR